MSHRIAPSKERSSSFISILDDETRDTLKANAVMDGEVDVKKTKGKSSRYIPPWTTPYIIGIGGASGSGKTSVAAKIVSSINVPWTVLISLDNFYNPLGPEDRARAFKNEYDFDEPNAINLDLAYKCILNLKEGKRTNIPVYSFVHHNRVPDKNIVIYGASVVVIEGIYALYDRRLLDLMDLKIYVDADLDVCLARRLSRDIVSRGRDLDGCIQQWEKFVKPNAVKFVKPTMKNADAIIPSMSDNATAVNLIINHIKSKLELKSNEHLRELIKLGSSPSQDVLNRNMIHELPPTNQVLSLHTMLLNKNLNCADFVFYFDRLATILLSWALDDIPVAHTNIITPGEHTMKNVVACQFDQVTAVNIIRSGDCFMKSLRKTIPNITIGKLLIQSDSQTGEPQLHCEFLPPNIEKFGKVFLMEGQIISGAAMIMAIQVLLDHGIDLEKISVVVYLATEVGIRRILNAFDNKVNIFAGMIISREKLQNHQYKWALTRFLDSKYFGCD
ncbi:Uridine kinase [Saccharomyces cerevisiae]|uniref:Uridine kinase n=2 Tax=Saccharomyces cerevisiae TaxID=4932 RepID=G2WL69_YEASK|nr:Urk1p [Saccharomyces cerevisiae YJM195]AJT05502.1 Urk1p [Saccharomyces cerevisiae YJM450]AJT05880.1 Urk1p [Saccharomyces cerevisiae YJM451]AJT06995.1 Urk1p [Saccharomyces cerevisiae YJM470]AJT16029.1 Urk1p [Saccharomyces cerevisiae YJM1202]AJT17526.1 Urk1p [Saccharomyces cerevisiae YJM1248]AJT18650.1 Urk1p [Saccharomyces cerevisiae YJM1273]AJT19387.1 Urk1p [Saccharomyces cerevisiae YJM1307]AJT20125.1 Urk1p [Saccharomyces cerevisiae YJM1326]AJT21993.1 Urk1p [Saccharomyces cerevisiae YJM1